MVRQIKGKDCKNGKMQRERDKAMKNNSIFQKYDGNFYKKAKKRINIQRATTNNG